MHDLSNQDQLYIWQVLKILKPFVFSVVTLFLKIKKNGDN
jgi:hypothetical protein